MSENERPLIDVAREMARGGIRLEVETDHSFAAVYVAGYEDGVAAAADIRGMHAATEEIGTLRARIAELEALNAHLRSEYNQLAARPAVIGVEVTDEMCETARITVANDVEREGFYPHWRDVLTAALRTARTVPLASVEPARWMKPQSTIGNVVQMEYYPPYNTPLYEGIAEVSRGE